MDSCDRPGIGTRGSVGGAAAISVRELSIGVESGP